MTQYKAVDIAIIGAMAEEVNALVAHLTFYVKHQRLNDVYYLGKLGDKDVVVVQSGIGKVSAAIATTFVFENFAPKCVINIGSAGGLDKALEIGDVVISSEVRYHDVDVTMIGCEYGQVPNMPSAFKADPQLVELARRSIEKVGIKAVEGLICTGDYFMSDPGLVAMVRGYFPSMIAADMEAAAIAQACYMYNCPFVVIRAISDVVEQPNNKVDFFTFLDTAAKNSAKFVVNMVKFLN